MLRILKLIVLGVLGLAIVVLGLANRQMVTLNLLPEGLDQITQYSIQIPLFLVSILSIGVGLLIGYILEWLREHKHRRYASEKAREAAKLEREVQQLKKQTQSEEDEILALLN